jgi:hypothetical protein
VLEVGKMKVKIRDVYGYPRDVNRRELSKFNP